MESMQREWKNFVDESQKSQQVVGQLSKLYIILHQNVRETILKCTINLKYNPTDDCNNHLKTILDLLKRMNDPSDTYLMGVDAHILNKFEEQLYDLSGQVQKLLETYGFTTGIDVTKLEAIKKQNDKEKYGLKDQLKQSENRRLRSRSGTKRAKSQAQGQGSNNELISTFSVFKNQFKQKRQRLLLQMEGHVQKKNNKLIFAKKYSGSNLQNYFTLRKELFDLQIADQYTQKIVKEYDSKPVEKEKQSKKDQLQHKLFGEFKIKTKYMKQNVKQNILNALVDVKTKLLEQYHFSNMKRLKEANPDTLIALVNPKHQKQSLLTKDTQSKKKRPGKHTSSASTVHQSPHNPMFASQFPSNKPKRHASLTRYPMAQMTHRPLVYNAGWTNEIEDEFRQTMTARLVEGKVKNGPTL